MKCCFCGRECGCAGAVCLCPDCLAQLLTVSPDEKRYDWFVSAMRRAVLDA